VDFLDAILVVVIIGSAAHGLRVGAAVQISTLVGVLAGVILGALLVVTVDSHITGSPERAFVALALLVFPAALFGGFARQLGMRAWDAIRKVRLGLVDALAGSLLAIAGTAVVLWLFASVLVNAPVTLVSSEINNSAVLRGIDAVLPPVPDAFARVEAYLAQNGFPQVVVGLVPGPTGKIRIASGKDVAEAAHADSASTVKVIAFGCGEELEGSGFEAQGNLIVTNAHVVAGASSITVFAENGQSSRAAPVLFDSRFDVAVLRTAPLGIPPLTVDTSVVDHGAQAVLLGYPEGGPLAVSPAGVLDQFTAEGRDIYGESLTVRQVYELQAKVEPGNSGGPLVLPTGQVIGVVFSRSTSNTDIGFALTSPGVAQRISEAQGRRTPVGTGQCVS